MWIQMYGYYVGRGGIVDVWACGCVSSRVHMGVHMYTHTIKSLCGKVVSRGGFY